VPYSPFFLRQVQQGNVAEITSTGTSIQGKLRRPEHYQGSKATTKFKIEIPQFADTKALAQLLQRKAWWSTPTPSTSVLPGGRT
jgi:hypothetical protein